MRRIALALILVAAVVGIQACAADAPSAPKPGNGGGSSSAISIQLFTSDANPKAGTCTLIEALVSVNGVVVPDGTSVNFSTDFGTFGENGLPLVSIVTTNGAATVTLCGSSAGSAKVKGAVTIAGKSNSAQVLINFQSDSSTLPFVSFCSPSFGPKEGGTALILNGGHFFGSAASTRVTFTVNGLSRDGLVTGVTANAISVTTPGFTDVASPSVQAAITLTLGTNTPTPVALSLPNCFVYGATEIGTPTVTAVLPASGSKGGGTRVTIVGGGFLSSGVQVFFGTVEATVVSVSYNQVVALSPPAPFDSEPQLSVPVTVKNITSGTVSNDDVLFSYTPDMHITAIANATQSTDAPFTPVTIYGTGFQAPVVVSLAGIEAFVQSVSATELVVIPGTPTGCGGASGGVVVVNITTGERAISPAGVDFTYVSVPMTAVNLIPSIGVAGTPVEIDGTNLPVGTANVQVLFGTRAALVNSATASILMVDAPAGAVTTAPTCIPPNVPGDLQIVETVPVTVKNLANSCVVTVAQSFSYQLPCVAP